MFTLICLHSEQKIGALRNAKYAYYETDEKISEKRMQRILEEYTSLLVLICNEHPFYEHF